MLTILSHRDFKERVAFDLCFYTSAGSAYMFACDEAGVVDESKLTPAAMVNYRRGLAGEFGEGQVQRQAAVETIPGQGECACGQVLSLWGDQSCKCGRMYNSAGQELSRLGYEDLPGEDY
jgi:hypothetical protein